MTPTITLSITPTLSLILSLLPLPLPFHYLFPLIKSLQFPLHYLFPLIKSLQSCASLLSYPNRHPWANKWKGPLTAYFGHDAARGLQMYDCAVGLDTGNILYCTVLYCTVLYCTVLYCTVLYCIVLCSAVCSDRSLCYSIILHNTLH